jgi:hypothetical protein
MAIVKVETIYSFKSNLSIQIAIRKSNNKKQLLKKVLLKKWVILTKTSLLNCNISKIVTN